MIQFIIFKGGEIKLIDVNDSGLDLCLLYPPVHQGVWPLSTFPLLLSLIYFISSPCFVPPVHLVMCLLKGTKLLLLLLLFLFLCHFLPPEAKREYEQQDSCVVLSSQTVTCGVLLVWRCYSIIPKLFPSGNQQLNTRLHCSLLFSPRCPSL